jgi:Bacterial archaeo-eukaryotic release factor family 11
MPNASKVHNVLVQGKGGLSVHTDIPTQADLEQLLSVRDAACVSIYLPTTPEERGERDRLEFKRLATEALEQLDDAPLDRDAGSGLRDALDELAEDREFWVRQAHSLAVFATPAGARTFQVANRLSPIAEVSDRFHVKPLLRSATFPQAAFVLALSQNAVRLVEVSPDAPPEEVRVPGMPSDAASAVGKASIADRSPDRRVQGSEGQKIRLAQYARRVQDALRPALNGLDLPLIVAATEPLASIFQSVSTYPHLAGAVIAGNPDTKTDAELAEASRQVLDELYAGELRELRDRYQQRVPQGRASDDLAAIARAATFGAVDTAFVDIDESVPGFVGDEDGALTLDDSDDAANYGVVDEIARRVLLARGRVLAVRGDDIPGGGPAAAILRYPV